jgi:hypothetical protein
LYSDINGQRYQVEGRSVCRISNGGNILEENKKI